MDAARVLAAANGRILRAYSRRTIQALRASLPLRMALPHLEPTLALNVAKEVSKDALVIHRAGEIVAAGRAADHRDLQQLYDASKHIDREFLARSKAFPVGIVVRYDEIAPVRLERIELLLGAACRVLEVSRREGRVQAGIRGAFAGAADLEQLLRELMRLYAEETRLISHAVELPKLLVPARENIARRLLHIMSEVAARLAGDLARLVYRGS
ncbi:MAG: hypothetical protein HY017_08785 [Betaproteobacteria bacterium]|nr:hypothetical protein [Betaproteobacteria bacterium]